MIFCKIFVPKKSEKDNNNTTALHYKALTRTADFNMGFLSF